MRKTIFLATVAVLAGCGGNGGTSAPSPFRGMYIGTYDSELGDSGTVSITIGEGGGVSGTATSSVLSASGPLTGQISSSGRFSGRVQIDGQQSGRLNGPLVIGSDGHLTGTVVETINGTSGDVVFDLNPVQT